jgi:hypothetical protein
VFERLGGVSSWGLIITDFRPRPLSVITGRRFSLSTVTFTDFSPKPLSAIPDIHFALVIIFMGVAHNLVL